MSFPSPESSSSTPPVHIDSELSLKRKTFACDSCHRKKIKCDVETPCNWCRHHGLPCTFSRSGRPTNQKKRKRESSKNEDRLIERIERLERALVQSVAEGKDNPDNVESSITTQAERASASDRSQALRASASVSNNGKIHFAGYNFATVSCFSGIPFFSSDGQDWIRARTGESITLDDLFPNGPPWENHKSLLNEPYINRKGLPSRALLEKYVEVYFSSFLHHLFPFLDRTLFQDTINAAYQNPQSHSSQLCVFSFLVFMSEFPNMDESLPPLDGSVYEFEAEQLVHTVTRGTVTVDGLQALLMLASGHMCKASLGSVDIFLAIAARMIFALGGHRKPTSDSSHIRTLFWLCYVIDKDLSLRAGRPPLLNDQECDLTLPKPYLDRLHRPNSDPTSNEDLNQFPGDLRLSMIKSKSYNCLYSIRALQKSDAELLRTIRELDEELARWKDSFPEIDKKMFIIEQGDCESMRWLMLTLEYHHCTTMIHQAVSRFSGWRGNQHDMEGVSSSLAMCVESSRCSLLRLKNARNYIPDCTYWVIIFYPVCALLTLFCNILLNPLHARAKEDINLIKEMSTSIGWATKSHTDSDAIFHAATLCRFLKELARLGQRAIDNI